ncbi:MAG: CotH kinase family protein [Bacteroidetes bacterium]|nr:CotH kinase family protein [Bacteroidota bacterium]
MFRVPFFLVLTLILTGKALSQPLPVKFNPVFLDTSVAVIELTLHPDSLALILSADSAHSDHEYPARFVFRNSLVQDTVENTGLRLRGNTSRDSQKKSFKVSFNTFKPGRKWHGLEKLNLNGEHNDPTISRSKLVWDISNQAGVPSSRAAFARVYINGAYFGLQMNVEHIDENFADSRFGSGSGNLYKCLWPADLAWLGSSANSWKKMSNGRRIYELQTNKEADDYSDLANFMKVLHQTPDSIFVREIQKVFNVNAFLKSMAVDVLAGSWDNYWILKNNFYLYRNPVSDRFEWIPYDYDNTLGIWWDVIPNGNIGSRNIYTWGNPSESRPLMTRILAQPDFKKRYTFFIRQLLNSSYKPEVQNPKIDEIHTRITPYAEADPYRPLDYGFTVSQFHQSFEQALGAHVQSGLKPFFQTRASSALNQLSGGPIAPVFVRVTQDLKTVPANGNLVITARVDSDSPIQKLRILTSSGGAFSEETVMQDDGLFPDRAAGDHEFTGTLSAPASGSFLGYYLEAKDQDARVSVYPDFSPKQAVWVPVTSSVPRLLINEIQADNKTTFADEAGQFDDWLELVNAGTESVSTAGWYLTDNRMNPNQWALPDTLLAPGGFLLIWADSDGKQGKWHASFKLAAVGEFAGLYLKSGESYIAADTLTFPSVAPDHSFGRVPDGGHNWAELDVPSPGKEIATQVGEVPLPVPGQLTVFPAWPNPFNPETTVSFRLSEPALVTAGVYDVLGRQVRVLSEGNRFPEGLSQFRIPGAGLSSGVYLIRIQAGTQSKTVKIQLIR